MVDLAVSFQGVTVLSCPSNSARRNYQSSRGAEWDVWLSQ